MTTNTTCPNGPGHGPTGDYRVSESGADAVRYCGHCNGIGDTEYDQAGRVAVLNANLADQRRRNP